MWVHAAMGRHDPAEASLRNDLDRRIPALVFKLGCYPLHHGGLAVIRSLGLANVAVYGVHEGRMSPAALSAYLVGGFIWPTGSDTATGKGLADGLRRIAQIIERPTIVVATDDQAAIALDEAPVDVRAAFLLPRRAAISARDLVDKVRCSRLAAEAGIPIVDAVLVRRPGDDIPDVPLPTIVKMRERLLRRDGTRGVSTAIAGTRMDLENLLRCDEGSPFEAMLQPLIIGEDWLYHGYLDGSSTPLVAFTGRKLHSRPAIGGETAFARTEANGDVRSMVEHFLRAISYAGPVSADVRYDRKARTYRLLDLNPRIGACFRMFVDTHGVDVVRAMHLDLSGREVRSARMVDGRTYIVENHDLVTSLHDAGPAAGLGAWWRRLRSANERAWLDGTDMVPVFTAAVRAGFERVRGAPSLAPESAHPRYFRGRAHRRARWIAPSRGGPWRSDS